MRPSEKCETDTITARVINNVFIRGVMVIYRHLYWSLVMLVNACFILTFLSVNLPELAL